MCEVEDKIPNTSKFFHSHFGSRAVTVQVNNVAVSDRVFHIFSVVILIQVSATQLSLFSVYPIRFDDYRSHV